jgi:hypothetical protein
MQDYNFYAGVNPDYLPKSYVGQLIKYSPGGMSPLFQLTAMTGEGKCVSVEHGYMTKTLVFPSMTLGAAVADGTVTTFTVGSTANVLKGDMFRVQSTGEIVRVSSIVSGTSVTVLRGVGQIAAAAISSGVVLYAVGNAHEQGSLRPASRLMNPVRVLNHTQIFRNSWQLPRTVAAITPTVGGSLPSESKEDCFFFHAADIEKALIWGQKYGAVVDGQYMTAMDGVVETVRRLAPAANTTTMGSTTNYTQLQAALDPGFNTVVMGSNTNERVFLAGGKAVTVVNDIGRLSGQYQIVEGATSFGLKFTQFRTARGVFRMIEHPLLNTNTAWAAMAISVHLGSLKICYLSKTSHMEYGATNVPVDNGIDAIGGTLTTELTLENLNPSAHCVLYGFTAAAAG